MKAQARLRRVERKLKKPVVKRLIVVYLDDGMWYLSKPYLSGAEPMSRDEVEELRADKSADIILISYTKTWPPEST